jgi:hypothetical protein
MQIQVIFKLVVKTYDSGEDVVEDDNQIIPQELIPEIKKIFIELSKIVQDEYDTYIYNYNFNVDLKGNKVVLDLSYNEKEYQGDIDLKDVIEGNYLDCIEEITVDIIPYKRWIILGYYNEHKEMEIDI